MIELAAAASVPVPVPVPGAGGRRRAGGARTRVFRVREGTSRDAGERGGDDVRRRLRRVVVAERAPTRAGEGEARLTTRCDRFRAFGRSVF